MQIYSIDLNNFYTIRLFFFVQLLITILNSNIYAQPGKQKDTKNRIVRVDNSFESPVVYSCRDSIYSDLKTNKISLFGEARIEHDGIIMTADLIEMDMDKNEVYCIYTLDEEGNRVGIPKFEQGAESFTAASIRYNFETQKGYIEELKTNQEELYLHMGKAKRQTNDHVHFVEGKITTCDLDEPHFHFQLSRAVMVPEKRIATGPMNLWVKGIPTPIGLPFSSLPMQGEEKETGGLLFPQIAPTSPFGMGFQDLGYYFPIKNNDHIQTTFYGSLYSQGTFELRNLTDYKKRYKYTGGVNLSYSSFKRPFPDNNDRQQKIVVQWNHQQEAKANPYWRFNSRVNFQSDNNGQTTLDPLSDSYFNTNFNSDINVARTFTNIPLTIGLKTSLKQNSASGNIDLDFPTLNINANRFFPFKALRKNNIGSEKWYEKIGVTYNLESKNKAMFHDSLIEEKKYDLIFDAFQNGINQDIRMITAIPLFGKTVTFSPNITYRHRTNFQQTRRTFDPVNNLTGVDTLREIGFSHDAALNLDLSTNLYAYYKFAWDKDLKMRHVITPTVSFRYSPNISSFITDNVGVNGESVTYSPFENSLYREPQGRDVGQLRYNINNTFELKRRAKKDSLEEFERIRIIDAFTISGDYDIHRDSMNLSSMKFAARFSPIPGLSFNTGADFSFYGWNTTTGRDVAEFARNTGQGLGRFTRMEMNTAYTFASKESKEKIEENQQNFNNHWEADFHYYALRPHEIIDFDIPWKVSLQYNIFFNINSANAYQQQRYRETQSLSISGDVSLTKRWKLAVTGNYDIVTSQMTTTRISMSRDMHCWQLGFFWTPVGGQKSFLVRFNATSNLFQAAKLELRKPPEFL